MQADISEPLPALPPVDRVFHLASPASPVGYMLHPIATMRTNSQGTHNLLQLAREHGARFLFTSTSEAYGNPLIHPQPETYFGNVNPIGPRACYDESKRYAEALVMEYVRQYDLDARIVRIFNTYGPRNDPQDGRVIPNFISAALTNAPIVIFGDGQQTRSLCFVSDLVRGLRAMMDTEEVRGRLINLGNPDERTIADLAQSIVSICGSTSMVEFLPAREDDPERRCPDITLAQRLLGWQPTIGLEHGLTRTIEYFRSSELVTV